MATTVLLIMTGCSSADEQAGEGLSASETVEPIATNEKECGPIDIIPDLEPMTDVNPGQHRVGIQLTLRDGATQCVITGHPNVEFIGGYSGRTEGESCAIRSTGEEPSPVVLEATESAHAIITFLDSREGPSPDYVRVGLPPVRWGKSFHWEHGSVLCHSAATHPGTYVGVILPGTIPAE